ncbi:SAM-dependent methyltransferase [Nonomuraea longicatena]|uniref:SAM-dependent methyltransferase n=1 Tax=Nonomuraea longicatena TaxID=83682 RepID=A0ABN1QIV1_9ACTN
MSETAPAGIDVRTANVARIYDFMLGGKDNFAADREAAEQIAKAFPESRDGVRLNRRFLGEAVRYLAAEAGIRQFVDVGAGLPTQQNVHEVAHSVDPSAKVVYVDNDPVVCVHGRALLANTSTVAMVEADLHEPETLLAQVAATDLIDFSQPVALLLVSVLHFMDDPYAQVTELRQALAPGSHLVISHMSMKDERSGDTDSVREIYSRTRTGVFPRTVADIRRFFGDYEVLDTSRFVTTSEIKRFAVLGWAGVGRSR